MGGSMFRVIIMMMMIAINGIRVNWGQQTHIQLEQGDVMGLKVFPDGGRTAVYAFLGLPYAQAPTGELRFAAAKPHTGWNRTFQAITMRPICPQLSNTIYDETADGSIARAETTSEDCLFLNIWTPETGMRYGNLPMLVIVTGEASDYDWPRNRANGLDFAAEGVVVVTVQYRTNIFGWLGLGHRHLPGNYGLSDIQMAMRWLHRNAPNFGGNAEQITLLGHGTGGAPLALASVLLSEEVLARQLVLMSPGQLQRALGAGHEERITGTSRLLVQKLSCHFEGQRQQMVACLRRKSVDDLLRAYESVYNHGNGSQQLGALLPTGLETRMLNASLPPLIVGISSNEGAFLQDYWLDLAREGHEALSGYINHTLLPNVLRELEQTGATHVNAITWRFFNDDSAATAADIVQLMWGMQRLLSEALHETPFLTFLDQMPKDQTVYAYVFDQSHAVDMRGKLNYFGGASHSADLPLLLGPSLFQQITRRRFSADEEQLCRKVRGAIANFIKGGNPTPGRIYDAWLPYTAHRPFIYSLGQLSKVPISVSDTPSSADRAQIDQLLRGEQRSDLDRSLSRPHRNDFKATTYLVASSRKGNSYVANNEQDSGYATHLRRVYGFWRVLAADNGIDGSANGDGTWGRRVRLLEASADALRYRQGFYAMLSLVCLLLGCLCLCVYLLRRDPLHRRSSRDSDGFCL